MAQELFAEIATESFSNYYYAMAWYETRREPDSIDKRFGLAWSIEWRTRLDFDITFSWWDETNIEYLMDLRLPVFGLPPFPEPDEEWI